ncbi:uncharacterized protein [Engystomops pustulosus]|uniref:uncharacterized protein isoform X1 n=1 Tax=Engystomops pustulosus TaxID=76066 RepID=UPI003AFB77DE
MPNCIINQCSSKTGKKGQSPHIILHPFPKDLIRIYRWLFHTGQQFSDIDQLANRIKAENKTQKFRLCSEHFSGDSYLWNATTRNLRREAVPTIFPPVEEGEVLIEESLKKKVYKRKRIVEEVQVPCPEPGPEDDPSVRLCKMSTKTGNDSFITFSKSTSQVVDNPALGVQYSHTGPSAPPPLLSSPNPKEMELQQNKRPNLSNVTTSDPRDFLTCIEPRSTKAEPPPDISRSLKVEPPPDIDYGNITTHQLPREFEETVVKIEETTSDPRDFLMCIEPRSTKTEPPPDISHPTEAEPPPDISHSTEAEPPPDISHSMKSEPPPDISHSTEAEPPPDISHSLKSEPPPDISHSTEAEPPPDISHSMKSEPPPDISHSTEAEPPPDISHSLKSEPPPDISHSTEAEPPLDISCSLKAEPAPDISRSLRAEPAPDTDYGNITTHQLPKEIENRLSILDKSVIKEEISDTDYAPGEKTFGEFLEETKRQPTLLDIRPNEEQHKPHGTLLIFESSLDQLLLKVKCLDSTGCSSLVETFEKAFEGGYCRIRGKCSAGHRFTMDLLLPY